MSYHAGMLGLGSDREATITCDGVGCPERIEITAPPPAWFLAGKAKRGWLLMREGDTRLDYCPGCKSSARLTEGQR